MRFSIKGMNVKPKWGVVVSLVFVLSLSARGENAESEGPGWQSLFDVMTYPHANSGIYFHTRYQDAGFPKFGVECQGNNSHSDWRRTGGLYGVSDLRETPVKDNVWYTQEIVVQGLHVTIRLDGKTVLEYTFPDQADGKPFPLGKKLYLPEGTIAFQGHDPGSRVCFKNIRIKVLD